MTPLRATPIDVNATALTDFFARVIITPEGRVNLQDLLKPVGAVSAAASGAAASAAGSLRSDAMKDVLVDEGS